MKLEDCIKEHFAFILTIIITYMLGILLVVVQYVALEESSNKNFMETCLDSFIPTTITYVLGCVLVNIVELFHDNAKHYIFNIFTCIFVSCYEIIFCIYVMTGFSFLWVVIEFMVTAFLLGLNIMCYKEKYLHRNHRNHRNHGLT